MKTSIYNKLHEVTLKTVNGVSLNVVETVEETDDYTASLEANKNYSDVKVSVLVHVFEQDYRTAVVFNDLDDEEYTVAELPENLDLSVYTLKMNKGICSIQKGNVIKFVAKVLAELEPQVNDILNDIDNPEITAEENEMFQQELEQEETSIEEELYEEDSPQDVFGDPELGHEDISEEDTVDYSEETSLLDL